MKIKRRTFGVCCNFVWWNVTRCNGSNVRLLLFVVSLPQARIQHAQRDRNFFANVIEESLLDSATDAYSNDVSVNGSTRWQRRQHRRNRNMQSHSPNVSECAHKNESGNQMENQNKSSKQKSDNKNKHQSKRSQSQSHLTQQAKGHSRSQSVFSDSQLRNVLYYIFASLLLFFVAFQV